MSTIIENKINFDELANIVFSKKEPFNLSEIIRDLGFSGDEAILKNIFLTLIDNGVILQQGSFYFLKK